MSDIIKRLLLISICLFGCFLLTACKVNELNKNDFQEVKFTEKQKLQVVTNDEVYNTFVLFNQNNDFSFCFSDEAPQTYKNILVEVKNNICVISNDGISYEKNINDFHNDFSPKIIYLFFSQTDFKNVDFSYNESEKSCCFEKVICDKTVVFTIQLSLDNSTQNYILEIR